MASTSANPAGGDRGARRTLDNDDGQSSTTNRQDKQDLLTSPVITTTAIGAAMLRALNAKRGRRS